MGSVSEASMTELRENGWTVLREVVDHSAVDKARGRADLLVGDRCGTEETEIIASEIFGQDDFSRCFLTDRVIRSLQGILGSEIVIYPNVVLRVNRDTDWHVDNGFHPDYHDDSSHLFATSFSNLQCATYFQRNEDRPAGGGLTVRTGSHRWYEDGVSPTVDDLLSAYEDEVDIDSNVGDVIVFDGRLIHRGTPRTVSDEVARRKMGLFWSVSRNNAPDVNCYCAYLRARAPYLRSIGLGDDFLSFMVRRYDDINNVSFPHSFCESARRALMEHKVEVPALA